MRDLTSTLPRVYATGPLNILKVTYIKSILLNIVFVLFRFRLINLW
jgi:hypothetical protein